jgi:hypothetical protein
MRGYIIKHKGKTWIGNMIFDTSIRYANGEKVYAQYLFYRKKDALKYLKTFKYSECFEVIGVTFDKSSIDNRKTKPSKSSKSKT